MVNHALLVLLPLVVLFHIFERTGILQLPAWIIAAERAVFPVYVWAIAWHIGLNYRFFRKQR